MNFKIVLKSAIFTSSDNIKKNITGELLEKIMKDMLNNSFANSSWNKENNPKIVLRKCLKIHQEFEIDRIYINIFLITSWRKNWI